MCATNQTRCYKSSLVVFISNLCKTAISQYTSGLCVLEYILHNTNFYIILRNQLKMALLSIVIYYFTVVLTFKFKNIISLLVGLRYQILTRKLLSLSLIFKILKAFNLKSGNTIVNENLFRQKLKSAVNYLVPKLKTSFYTKYFHFRHQGFFNHLLLT